MKRDSFVDLQAEVDRFFETACVSLQENQRRMTQRHHPKRRGCVPRSFHLAKQVPGKATFTVANAKKLLPDLHALTTSEHEARNIPEVLGEMGIRLVVIEHLAKTKIDGRALWLDENSKVSPVIALSSRYERSTSFGLRCATSLCISCEAINGAWITNWSVLGKPELTK